MVIKILGIITEAILTRSVYSNAQFRYNFYMVVNDDYFFSKYQVSMVAFIPL